MVTTAINDRCGSCLEAYVKRTSEFKETLQVSIPKIAANFVWFERPALKCSCEGRVYGFSKEPYFWILCKTSWKTRLETKSKIEFSDHWILLCNLPKASWAAVFCSF